jgi:hypothetical protein
VLFFSFVIRKDASSLIHYLFGSMDTDGGGWTICFTTNWQARFSTEWSALAPYGLNGYRTDCTKLAFQEVVAINHDAGQVAWFKQKDLNPKTIVMAQTNYNVPGATYALWTGFGVATSSLDYQFLLCDSPSNVLNPGLFFSGYTVDAGSGCTKLCGSWCNDLSSLYFRISAGSNGNSYLGVPFGENGHRSVGSRLVSYGIRQPIKFACETFFEGGGWALVRRVKQGATWHPATDTLHGTDVYGSPDIPTADTTFSVPFWYLLSPNTEFLFATGLNCAAIHSSALILF